MAYCTQAQLIKRISEEDLLKLADQDGDDVVDADVVTQAIEDACGVMDSYLQVKYVVPVAPPIPKVLRSYAIGLTICILKGGRDSVTEDAKAECDRVYEWLEAVVAGKVELGIEPKPAESSGSGGVRMNSSDRLFGRDKSL